MSVLESLASHMESLEKEKETKGHGWSYNTAEVIHGLRILTNRNEIEIKKKKWVYKFEGANDTIWYKEKIQSIV